MKDPEDGCDPRPYTHASCCSKRLEPEIAQWYLDEQKRKRFGQLIWPYRLRLFVTLVFSAILCAVAAVYD